MKFIDLSHDFAHKMPGFRMRNKDGQFIEYSAKIYPFLTHKQSSHLYQDKSQFEITEIHFQTSVGTYLDSPYHRFPTKRDISEIKLEEVILPGIVIDARNYKPNQSVGMEILPEKRMVSGKAILINFGWDRYYGTDEYYSYPYIDRNVIKFFVDNGSRLVGVDTINIDNSKDPSRPAHTKLLEKDILIVENLKNLHTLYEKKFRLFAVPIKGVKVAAMPVRAFAEILY